jgi:curli biogenesis system outer membrane secretion channel CsgG
MDKLWKLALLGMMAFSFVATEVYAAEEGDDDDTAEEAPKKVKKSKKGKKRPAPSKVFVSVHKFDNKSSAKASDVETVQSRIQQFIVGTRKFEVIEREQLKTVMKEQGLAAGGVTDAEDGHAPEQGKIKPTAFVVYGNILYYGVDKSGAKGSGYAVAQTKSKVEIQVKFVRAETGKIILEKSFVGEGFDKSIATGDSLNTKSGGMRDAIDEACHMVVDALREHTYPPKIVAVDDDEIRINMTDSEVKDGDVFDVKKCGEEKFDPDTGESLGYSGKTVGRVIIHSADARMATGEASECVKIKKGKIEKVEWDTEDLDPDEDMYMLHRVHKSQLLKEKKMEARQGDDEAEHRFT